LVYNKRPALMLLLLVTERFLRGDVELVSRRFKLPIDDAWKNHYNSFTDSGAFKLNVHKNATQTQISRPRLTMC
jgi:hypothetical protein